VALVFQSYALYPTMNAFDNIAFPLRLRKLSADEIRRQVEETAEMLDITRLLRRRPRELSGGERQRVALGRAIIRRPKVFLLDEPLSNLDATLRVQMRQELKRLHNVLGATFLYVTHDQDDALVMGDRVAVLAGGRLQQFSSPTDVFDRPANRFVASFIGRVPTNFLTGTLERGARGLVFSAADVVLPLPGLEAERAPRELELGLRPEGLLVGAAGEQGLIGRVDSISVVQPNIYVSVQVGPHVFVARVPDNLPTPMLGDEVPLRVDPGRVSLFDAATGVRVPLVSEPAATNAGEQQPLGVR
jgi:multiple sugar transport system ATP-binding protein